MRRAMLDGLHRQPAHRLRPITEGGASCFRRNPAAGHLEIHTMLSPLRWLKKESVELQAPDGIIVLVDPTLDSKLVVYHEPLSYPAEQYRSFRTNLRAMNPGDSPRTLLFTSTAPAEGKTTTLANIALSLAEFEHLKVCLIDMDLRAPAVHELFGLPRRPGITDVLLDRVDPRRVMLPGGLPNLTVVPAGRATSKPSEVTGSEYLQDLIAFLKRDFDYVLFDSPPCTLFGDACDLSKLMDGTILVVALGDTTRKEADQAIAALDAAGANVIGSFVTGARTSPAPTVVADVEQI